MFGLFEKGFWVRGWEGNFNGKKHVSEVKWLVMQAHHLSSHSYVGMKTLLY